MDRFNGSEIGLLDRSPVPYRLRFRETHSTPTLDKYVSRGDPKNGTPFASKDLELARVGFIKRTSDGEIDCDLGSTRRGHRHTDFYFENGPSLTTTVIVGEGDV